MPLPDWMYSQLAARGLRPCGHPQTDHPSDDCPSCSGHRDDNLPQQD